MARSRALALLSSASRALALPTHTGRSQSLALVLSVAASLSLSCTVETTRYQSPEALAKKSAPEPPPGIVPTDNGPTTERTCSPPAVPDATCAESWNAIYTTLIKGTWHCADKPCHAPGSGFAPTISDTDAKVARRQLLAYVMPLDAAKTPPKQYMDQCSRDPTASSIICNIRTDANPTTCGSSMPKFGYAGVQGVPATAADVQRLTRWIGCGSPDN